MRYIVLNSTLLLKLCNLNYSTHCRKEVSMVALTDNYRALLRQRKTKCTMGKLFCPIVIFRPHCEPEPIKSKVCVSSCQSFEVAKAPC